MKLTHAVALLACLMLLGSPQDFTGGLMPNLYTGIVMISPTIGESLQSFSVTLNPAFAPTTQDFLIATAIRDFGAVQLDTGGNSFLHIQVLDEKVVGGSAFNFNVNYKTALATANPVIASIDHVTFSYIIVGSEFPGDTGYTSSFIFARNAKLQQSGNGLVDFTNPIYGDSPFNWDQATNGEKCGAIKIGNVWRIDPTTCESILAQIFITGFEQPTPASAGDSFVTITTDLASSLVDLGSDAVYSESALIDGISIDTTASVATHIQFSIVVVAIRDFSFTSYPSQSVYIDQFIASWVNNIVPDMPNVGDLTFGEPTVTVDQYPYLTSYNDPSQVAYRFCGMVNQDIDSTTTGSAGDYQSYKITEFDFVAQTITIEKPEIIPAGGTTDVNAYTVQASIYTCLMINNRNSCDEDSTIAANALFTQDTFTIVQTPSTTANTAQWTSNLGAEPDSYEMALSDPVYYDFQGQFDEMTMTIEEVSQTVFTLTKVGVEAKAYEGVLHLFVDPVLETPETYPYNQTIKLTVFGNEVINTVIPITQVKTFHFAFLNTAAIPADGTGQVVLSYETDYEGTSSFVVNAQFGIVEQTNLLSETQQCVLFCPPIVGFSVGISLSTSPPTCIRCSLADFLIYNPEIANCDCQEGYRFDSSGFCQPCDIDLCASCSATGTPSDYCYQCVEFAEFVDPAITTQGCACIDGYYQDGLTCLPCQPGCVTCQDSLTCEVCVANADTRLGISFACKCKDGYFENGSPICEACSPECATCETTATNCLTCGPNFTEDGTTCVCDDGFTLVIDSATARGSCVACDISCATCAPFLPNVCVTCADLRIIDVNNPGKCICKPGYINYNGNCLNSQCQTIDPDCQQCGFVLSTGLAICQACGSDLRVLSPDNLTCLCKVGYFEDTLGECQPCGFGCANCTSASVCNVCADGALQAGNGACACTNNASYILEAFGRLFCQPCSPTCQSCQDIPTQCTSCPTGFDFNDVTFTCTCKAGTYLAPNQASCASCGFGCILCTVGTICESCASGYTLNNGRCVLECPPGTYDAGTECRQCSDNCRACTSAISCRACLPNFFLYAGSCRSACSPGTFPVSNVCIACAEPCTTCSQSAFNCITCAAGTFFSNGQCVTSCPDKYYSDGSTCQPCSPNCFNCLNSATNCVSCPDGQFLLNGKCSNTCPYVVGPDGSCTNNCPAGTYLANQNCYPCQGACKTCTAANTCTSCNNDKLYVYNGQCVASCPPNSLVSGRFCSDCDKSCNGCISNPLSCIRCTNGYYWFKERCYSTCPAGTYLDYATGFCKLCDAGCKQCTGPGNCQICADSTQSVNNQCGNTCGSNCLVCEGDVCKLCVDGFISSGSTCQRYCPAGASPVSGTCVCNSGTFFHQNSCVGICPGGYLGVNGKCVQCVAPCATCVDSITKCSTCQDGYTLEQVTGRCTNSEPCPYGLYRSLSGGCKPICPLGSYFGDNACFEGGCPIGYVVDENNRACIKSTIPTGCTIPFFLQGNRCVLSCDAGFYPEPTTRVCKPCSSNCYTCLSAGYCTSCTIGFSLVNFACLQSTSCAAGLFRLNDKCLTTCPSGYTARDGYCVRICPAGTYFWNRGCYETCPTGLRTDSACVLLCPAGFVKKQNICEPTVSNCQTGQFYNSALGRCDVCRFPCTSCEGSSITCTSCADGYTLDGNTCVRRVSCPNGQYQAGTGCLNCPVKCATCSGPDTCDTCAIGYINNGADCVPGTTALQPLNLQIVDSFKRGSTVFIKTKPTIVPANLASTLQSQILLFVPERDSGEQVTNWIEGEFIYTAVTYPGAIPSMQAYLLVNSPVVSSVFQGMGYSTANSYALTSVSPNLPEAPAGLVIPPQASNSAAIPKDRLGSSAVRYSLSLNSIVSRAIRF